MPPAIRQYNVLSKLSESTVDVLPEGHCLFHNTKLMSHVGSGMLTKMNGNKQPGATILDSSCFRQMEDPRR